MNTLLNGNICCCDKELIGYEYKFNMSTINSEYDFFYITYYNIPDINQTIFIAVGRKAAGDKNGAVFVSYDLKTWSQVKTKCVNDAPANATFYSVACDQSTGDVVACGIYGCICYFNINDYIANNTVTATVKQWSASKNSKKEYECNMQSIICSEIIKTNDNGSSGYEFLITGGYDKGDDSYVEDPVSFRATMYEFINSDRGERKYMPPVGKTDYSDEDYIGTRIRYIYYDKYNKLYITVGEHNLIAYTREIVDLSGNTLANFEKGHWTLSGQNNKPYVGGDEECAYQYITYDPNLKIYVVVGNHGDIFYTRDISASEWNHCPMTYDPTQHIQAVVYDPVHHLYLAAGYCNSIMCARFLDRPWYNTPNTFIVENVKAQCAIYHEKYGVIICGNSSVSWSNNVEPIYRERIYTDFLNAIFPVGFEVTNSTGRNPCRDYNIGVWEMTNSTNNKYTFIRIK